MTPSTLTLLAVAALLVVAGWLAFQLYRIGCAVRRGRRAIAEARISGRHQTDVRLFVETQTKLTRLDIRIGTMFGIPLLGVLVLITHLLVGLRAQS